MTKERFHKGRRNAIGKTLKEIQEQFADKPVSEQKYTIDGTEYVVISHYTGDKDIDTVLRALAEKRAYADIQNL